SDRDVEHTERSFLRKRRQPLDRIEGQVSEQPLLAPGDDSAAGRRRLAPVVFPGEQPVGERIERKQTEAVAHQGWNQLVLRVAFEQVVLVLSANEPVPARGPGGPFRLGY